MDIFPNFGCLYGDILNDIPDIYHSRVNGKLAVRDKVWTLRYIFMFRAIQYGYNAMVIDSDARVTRDIYRTLKSEQLSEF